MSDFDDKRAADELKASQDRAFAQMKENQAIADAKKAADDKMFEQKIADQKAAEQYKANEKADDNLMRDMGGFLLGVAAIDTVAGVRPGNPVLDASHPGIGQNGTQGAQPGDMTGTSLAITLAGAKPLGAVNGDPSVIPGQSGGPLSSLVSMLGLGASPTPGNGTQPTLGNNRQPAPSLGMS